MTMQGKGANNKPLLQENLIGYIVGSGVFIIIINKNFCPIRSQTLLLLLT